MLKKCPYFFIVAILVIAGIAAAEENNFFFGYDVVRDASGTVRLKITTHVVATGMWLGVTLYPPQVKNPAMEAVSQLFPIKQGRGITEIVIEPNLKNGTFESAVWKKKLSRNECLPTDELCKRLGYKVTHMVSYLWGHLEAP